MNKKYWARRCAGGHAASPATSSARLATLRSQLFIMANVGVVEGEGFDAFYTRAHQVMTREGMNVILSDLDGNELINARLPFGQSLPPPPARDAVRRVAATGQPYVSDLATSTVSHKPIALLSVPVVEGRSTGLCRQHGCAAGAVDAAAANATAA